jgi:hypothetical protein
LAYKKGMLRQLQQGPRGVGGGPSYQAMPDAEPLLLGAPNILEDAVILPEMGESEGLVPF